MEIRSNSRAGIANVILRLHDEVEDTDEVWSQVRAKLRVEAKNLPAACQEPSLEVFPLKAYAALVAVKWHEPDRTNPTILRKLSRELQNRLSAISGTEAVVPFGVPHEEYKVTVQPSVLVSLQMSVGAIAQQLAGVTETAPAGSVREEQAQLLVGLEPEKSKLARLRNAGIRSPLTGEAFPLGDIATVTKVELHGDYAFVDGERAVVLAVSCGDRLRMDRWVSQLDKIVSQFREDYSAEVTAETIFSQQDYISKRLTDLLDSLVVGALAVVVVVLLLMGWRSMIVVGCALPLSVLMVISGMRLLGIPLHQMSVTGLIIALGLLIDNAIVIVEDVRSRVFAGCPVATAVRDGIRHLAMPLCGSTLTTALAFMPIATLPGPPGEFVGTIAVGVILAITASLLLAMTVVPALLGLMDFDSAKRSVLGYGIRVRILERLYERSLRAVYRVPVLGVAIGAVLPAVGFWSISQLPEQFFPVSDRDQLQIELELEANSSIEKSSAIVKQLHSLVVEQQQVERAHWFVGGSAPTFFYNVVPRRRETPFYAQAIVELSAANDPGVARACAARKARHVFSAVAGRGPSVGAGAAVRCTD